MTRRALFARLAGLMGVPYVAKALPVPALKPGDVFTMASVNVVNYRSEAYMRAAVEAIAADIEARTIRFHRDAFVMTWPKVGE